MISEIEHCKPIPSTITIINRNMDGFRNNAEIFLGDILRKSISSTGISNITQINETFAQSFLPKLLRLSFYK